MMLEVDFSLPPGPPWKRFVLPGSVIEHMGTSWRFANDPVDAGHYTDAQIDDYQGLRRRSKGGPAHEPFDLEDRCFSEGPPAAVLDDP